MYLIYSERNLNMYDHILVAVDGSKPSGYAGQAAIEMASATGARVTACHIYGAEIHQRRFSDMEPGLPTKYQQKDTLNDLRSTHDKLMQEGFRTLSAGYVEDFVASCRDAGIAVESVAVEGRAYVGIIQLAEKHRCDLIALGADGLGAIGNGLLGGTTSRVLQSAPCDVLVARCGSQAGPILAGVDGSTEAIESVTKAVSLAIAMGKPIHMAAVYDPDFHTRVFGVMAQSLSPEDQELVGLAGQEKLHDDIINDGLGKLYADFLHEAQNRCSTDGVTSKAILLTGKPYCALDSYAGDCQADMIVVNRHGNHRQRSSRLGSNAEGLLRTASANILLVGGINEKLEETKTKSHAAETTPSTNPLDWDRDAKNRLKRVPFFVRGIAKRAVENAVCESGGQSVSAADFDKVAARFGMGIRGGNT
jgi:nucleotide-binding universal stress UspA family protein